MSFVAMFLQFHSFPRAYQALVCTTPSVLLVFRPSLKFKSSINGFILLFLAFPILSLPAFISQGQSLGVTLFSILSFTHSITIAYILSEENLSHKIVSFPFLVFSLLSLFLMRAGINPNDFFSASQNAFSWVALFGASLSYIIQYKQNPFKPSLWPALAAFAISFWALGRSGIASTGFLLLGVLVIRFKHSRNKPLFLFASTLLLTLFSSLFMIYQGDVLLRVAARFTMERHAEDPRVDINANYIQNINSPKKILFGFNLRDDWYMSRWDYNPHNSYIKFHSTIGASSAIIFVFVFLGMILKGFQYSLFWFVGCALLFRVGTDSAGLLGPIDPALFFFLFSWREPKFREKSSPKSRGRWKIHLRNTFSPLED